MNDKIRKRIEEAIRQFAYDTHDDRLRYCRQFDPTSEEYKDSYSWLTMDETIDKIIDIKLDQS